MIARLRTFVDLSAGDIEELRTLMESDLATPRRRDLVVDGYEYRKLAFVNEGYAARYKLLRNGKRQIINVIVPGDIIGLPSSFLDLPTFSVIALTDMKMDVCALETFVEFCYRRSKFALALSWLAVQEATTYAEHIVDIGRRTSVERLAHFLLEMHARLSTVGMADGNVFDLPISQEVISDALGLSVPHLNRMIAKLRADRMIAIAERRVELLDPQGLRMLAHFQPGRLSRIPSPFKRLTESAS
ncbi:MAG TPA: Crp/Fnr family transcriptional regulator [Reyranella sp.]|nr:Crp/Fnr family transcriptional regulator [Reyranella sp.]